MRSIRIFIISLCTIYSHLAFANLVPAVVSESLENWLVEAYLKTADSVYHANIGREGVSILDHYVLGRDIAYYRFQIDSLSSPNWAERPNPIKIPVRGGETQLHISSSPLFTTFDSYDIPQNVDTFYLYNLIPQKIYWYQLLDSINNIQEQGVFKTLGHMRAIYSPNIRNIRDIGGKKCNGGRIKYGRIYRGGQLEKAQDEDVDILVRQVGLGTDIDLRHDAEPIEYGNHPSPLGINYQWEEILAYMYLVTNSWGYEEHKAGSGYYASVGNIVKNIVNNNPSNGAFYIHCTAGADRTGIIIALIEGLCGVSEEDIVKDWELTTFSNYEKIISRENNNWQHYNSQDELVIEKAELRHVFQYFFDHYNNSTQTYTFQQQVESWFRKKVFVKVADQNKYIAGLKSYLVESDDRMPMLIYDGGNTALGYSYLVIDQTPCLFRLTETSNSASSGDVMDNEAIGATEFIDCRDYKYLLSNVEIKNAATFYDSSYNFIGGVGTDKDITDDTVLFISTTKEYPIPQQAAYIKVNIPKYSEAYAVLSVNSLIN